MTLPIRSWAEINKLGGFSGGKLVAVFDSADPHPFFQVYTPGDSDVALGINFASALDPLTNLFSLSSISTNGISVDVLTAGQLPWMVWHRFGLAIGPENVMETGRATLGTPPPAIEFDPRLLLDGVFGVMHDFDMTRMTNLTATVGALTAAAFLNATTKVSGSDGGHNQFQITGSTTDAWNGTYHPPLLEQVFSEWGARRLLILDPKDTTIAAFNALDAVVRRYNLQKSVMFQCGGRAYSDAVLAAGYVTCFEWDGTTPFSTLAAAGYKWIYLAFGYCTDATINAIKAAGIPYIYMSVLERQSDWLNLSANVRAAITAVESDDAYYLSGATRGDYSYRLTTDPFVSNTWYHGMAASVVAKYDRGYFINSRFGFKGNIDNSYTLQGWACPLAAPTAYTISFTLTLDQLDTDASAYAAVFFSDPYDYGFTAGASSSSVPGETGYRFQVQANGMLSLFKHNGSSPTTTGPTQSTAAILAGGTATFTIHVTPSQILITRTDVSAPNTLTYNDATWRGPYFYFGLHCVGSTFLHPSFSSVFIT